MTTYIQASNINPDVKAVMEQMVSGGVGLAPGTLNASSATVSEAGAGSSHTTTIVFSNLSLTVADATQGVGYKIYTFPVGKVLRMGASFVGTVTTATAIASTLNSGVTCDVGVGSTTQANATLATTEQDFVQVTTFTSSTTINVAPASVHAYGIPNVTLLDGSSSAIAAFFNLSVPTATDIDGDATVLVNGTVTINWVLVP